MPFIRFLFLTSALVHLVYAQSNSLSYTSSVHLINEKTVIDLQQSAMDVGARLQLITPLHPSPVSEVKKSKLELDALRLQRSKNSQTSNSSYKTASVTPVLGKNFQGNIIANGTPNDNDFAISNDGKIISVCNTNLYFFDSTGAALTPAARTLAFFANKLGSLNRTYDPRVIYDPIADRFIVVFLQGSTSADTRIITAFSQTNNPVGAWNFYVVPGNITGDSSWSDYPIISITNKELFITINRLKDNKGWKDGFIESYIWQVDKQKAYNGDTPLVTKNYRNIQYNGRPIWSICPARPGVNANMDNAFFLSVRPSDLKNDTVFIHEITGTLASNPLLKLKVIKAQRSYGLQPNAFQPGGKKLQTNDARVLSACVQDNFIHYVQNTIDTNTFSPSVYYGRIENPQSANPVSLARIISYDSMDIAYPSIAFVGNGGDDRSVMITFSHASAVKFPGTSFVYVDRNGVVSAPVHAKIGQYSIQVLSDSIERWGDYTGIQRKYNETGICWLNGSFANSSKQPSTWIAQVRNNDPFLGNESLGDKNTASMMIYPNPSVNEFTTIEFSLNQSQLIQFKVMGLDGKLIANVLQEKAKAGLNKLYLRTADLPNGVYLLQLQSEHEQVLQAIRFVVAH